MPVTLQTTTSFPSRGRSRSRLDLTKIESEMPGTASVPSAPVQIPASRRPAPSVVVSNNGNSGFGLTPDAVFDMSPVTSEFGSSPSSQTDRSKFLYNFPSLPRHQPFSGPRRVPSRYGAHSPSPPNPSEDRSAEVASRYRVADPLAPRQASRSPYLCKGSNVLDEYDLSPGGMSPDSYSPMKENHRVHALPFRRTLRSQTSLGSIPRPTLSPGPRQPLGETSPWLFPGRGVKEDGEDGPSSGGKKSSREDAAGSCSYSHVDPGVFEYKNHLLKRLESRYPSRLNMGPSMQ
ncbi:hypothetical protein BKA70DRAFT_1267631 [Coprinopsis sp. MPI-PUGE-AT-0042]|nr:hypothetical protein BKA70DRAFT_1267631 [Coprinopsis sp. MPI-PUGE-AT-0042]